MKLIDFQWTSTETKSFNNFIIHLNIMIARISYRNIFTIFVPERIDIVPL